jgi:hypothetical protein
VAGGKATYYTALVDAYNNTLVRSSLGDLSTERESVVGARVGQYAVLVGCSPQNNLNIDAYNSSLVRVTTASLSALRYSPAAISFGEQALFFGGTVYGGATSSLVEGFDSNLVRTAFESLSVARAALKAATIGNYALLAGGVSNTSTSVRTNVVDAYTA